MVKSNSIHFAHLDSYLNCINYLLLFVSSYGCLHILYKDLPHSLILLTCDILEFISGV